jgi:hypothetical protein
MKAGNPEKGSLLFLFHRSPPGHRSGGRVVPLFMHQKNILTKNDTMLKKYTINNLDKMEIMFNESKNSHSRAKIKGIYTEGITHS